MTQQITPETRQRLAEIINAGLVSGLGTPKPGGLCIEAAICLALGEPHSDRPSCVAEPDRKFAIVINDAQWSSSEARARALLPLALAQLGTAGTDRSAWIQALALGTVQRVLPTALRAAGLHEHAERCAQVTTLEEALAAAYAAAGPATAATALAAATPLAAALAATRRAAYATTADAEAAAYAARAATAYAARATAYAADAADARAAIRDEILKTAIRVALDAYAAEGREQL
jgi:hypothetical protein